MLQIPRGKKQFPVSRFHHTQYCLGGKKKLEGGRRGPGWHGGIGVRGSRDCKPVRKTSFLPVQSQLHLKNKRKEGKFHRYNSEPRQKAQEGRTSVKADSSTLGVQPIIDKDTRGGKKNETVGRNSAEPVRTQEAGQEVSPGTRWALLRARR